MHQLVNPTEQIRVKHLVTASMKFLLKRQLSSKEYFVRKKMT